MKAEKTQNKDARRTKCNFLKLLVVVWQKMLKSYRVSRKSSLSCFTEKQGVVLDANAAWWRFVKNHYSVNET